MALAIVATARCKAERVRPIGGGRIQALVDKSRLARANVLDSLRDRGIVDVPAIHGRLIWQLCLAGSVDHHCP